MGLPNTVTPEQHIRQLTWTPNASGGAEAELPHAYYHGRNIVEPIQTQKLADQYVGYFNEPLKHYIKSVPDNNGKVKLVVPVEWVQAFIDTFGITLHEKRTKGASQSQRTG